MATQQSKRIGCISWIALGLAFTGFVFLMYERGWFGATLVEPSTKPGIDAATMYATAYVLEYAIAFDNLFIIALLFQALRVPEASQRRLLRWALLVAIAMRLLVLAGAADLAKSFDGVLYVLGGYLAYQGARLMLPDEIAGEREEGLVERVLRRFEGQAAITGVAVAIGSKALVDLAFAFDSVAALSVSRTAFIVVTSNVMATLGLRSLYGVLVSEPTRFDTMRPIAALMLVLAGFKLLARDFVVVPHAVFFVVTAVFVVVGLVGARSTTRA